MARPAKSTKVMAKNLTADERAARIQTEDALRGKADELTPPDYLTESQQSIFAYIVSQLQESGILGNLDVYILTAAAVAIDRLGMMEDEINRDPELLSCSAYMASKEKYSRDFYRCCNELCLSPQARAKLAGLKLQRDKGENPLIEALRDD